ncbi:MAG TPA: hypothetical protein VFU36_02645, partial [Jatrophihabitans sp.]|nr:hypothetical protein [Jatrophihabitans sp.]
MPEKWVRVPIGDGAGYRSVQFQRTVLVVARTALTTEWLLDVAPDILADPRVQVVFTVEDEQPSVYHAGAQALLGRVAAATIPWSQALATDFDLIITATRNGSLGKLRGPLLITPHGAGYGKLGSLLPDGAVPTSKPTPHSIQRFRNQPHTALMLSHPEQAALFAAGTGVRLAVIGDPVWDQLQASLRLRTHYRSAYQVTPGQRMVLLTSTWGPHSVLGAQPDLPVRLLRELPLDDYRLVLSLHSNIWNGHGGWQVRTWLRRAIEAGAILLPNGNHWRSAVIAADLMVSDHGSSSCYAAALGKPLLLASFDEAGLIEGSPI